MRYYLFNMESELEELYKIPELYELFKFSLSSMFYNYAVIIRLNELRSKLNYRLERFLWLRICKDECIIDLHAIRKYLTLVKDNYEYSYRVEESIFKDRICLNIFCLMNDQNFVQIVQLTENLFKILFYRHKIFLKISKFSINMNMNGNMYNSEQGFLETDEISLFPTILRRFL